MKAIKEVTVLEQDKIFTSAQKIQARKNIDAACNSDVTGLNTNLEDLSGKTVTEIQGDNITSARLPDGTIKYNIDVTPLISAIKLSGQDGVYTQNISGANWLVGLSGEVLSAINSISSKLDISETSSFYPIYNPSGYISDESLEYDEYGNISAIAGSPLAGSVTYSGDVQNALDKVYTSGDVWNEASNWVCENSATSANTITKEVIDELWNEICQE